MDSSDLFLQIKIKRSFLCVGLDTDYRKIPEHLRTGPDAVFEFNKQIIEATAPYTVAYKLNTAFYEAMGVTGWVNMKKTVEYIRQNYADMFIIADAKRGDIGNTSELYAHAFFKQMDTDAITVNPYMGEDSVAPFLKYPGKWAIILAATSNEGSADFQRMEDRYSGLKLFERIIEYSKNWGNTDNTMYVVGATRAELLKDIRNSIPKHFLLIPGVGAQGGNLREVCKNGMNDMCGLLVNSSRAILYADNTERFAEVAGQKAEAMQEEMYELLQQHYLM